MSSTRSALLALLSGAVLGGTLYSVLNHTYLDTSDPLLSHLPHPLHHQSIFAQRTNIFNSLFVKKAWGWTSAAFATVWLTSPPQTRSRQPWSRWAAATAVWGAFAAWFFGPSLLERLAVASGGSCVLHLPSDISDNPPVVHPVPLEYCSAKTIVSPSTHPALFPATLLASLDSAWMARPRLYNGHDVSGHIFLLTLSALFLHSQLEPAWKLISSPRPTSVPFKFAVVAATALFGIWLLMTLATSIYWHTPFEKLTGFALGLGGFALVQFPFSSSTLRVARASLSTRVD
ncbi:inositol phospholipid synthesis and fat-storage-inducing TM-domain-containing protein [Gautieria morchelliformis]|nr:inositol phospholipid synthesis and fat-storage-inducing TM-domain-containing protein [Gautieria morchelliformis]